MNGYSIHHARRDLDMEAIAAFDDREEKREQKRVAAALARGATHGQCRTCGQTYPLSWVGAECNAEHPYSHGDACEGRIVEVIPLPITMGQDTPGTLLAEVGA